VRSAKDRAMNTPISQLERELAEMREKLITQIQAR